jgi:hypothetical protein
LGRKRDEVAVKYRVVSQTVICSPCSLAAFQKNKCDNAHPIAPFVLKRRVNDPAAASSVRSAMLPSIAEN